MSYLRCLDDCRGSGVHVPWGDSTINWIGETTQDQIRIECVLEKLITPESVILHVGIGNSAFADRFASRVKHIDGITLGQTEVILARNLRNYEVWRANKYHTKYRREYDFIIDNNLGSYACCITHFHSMMDAYRDALRLGGMILTDRAGLKHAPGDPNWDLSGDIQSIADKFGLRLTEETEMVLALRK